MRKNEYKTLNEFTSQYTGVWAPSDGHWFGLDFRWHGKEYRLHTGNMYENEPSLLANGQDVLFGLYEKTPTHYNLLTQFATMDGLLTSTIIESTQFADIIMDDDTELLGQD